MVELSPTAPFFNNMIIYFGPSSSTSPNRSYFSARWKTGINWALPPHKDEAFARERTMLGDPFLQVLSFYFCLKIDPIKTWPSSDSDKSFLTCGSFEALSEMSTSTPGTSISTWITNWIFFGSWLRQKTTISFLLIWLLSHFNLESDRISSSMENICLYLERDLIRCPAFRVEVEGGVHVSTHVLAHWDVVLGQTCHNIAAPIHVLY